MIQFGVVVQRQRVIAQAPAIADAGQFVDHQRIDADAPQHGCEREPGLAATDDQYRGFAIGIGLNRFALFFPVGTAEVARERLAGRATIADGFLKALQLVQTGHELKRFGGIIRQQPQHTKTAPDFCFKLENGLDHIVAGALHAARWRAARRDGESACLSGGLICH